jgi:aminopeptidase Y
MILSLLALNLGCAAALQLPDYVNTRQQQQPLHYADKPLVDSASLEATIHSKNLLSRAKELFEIAKLGEDEYNHPTRVIGSKGPLHRAMPIEAV